MIGELENAPLPRVSDRSSSVKREAERHPYGFVEIVSLPAKPKRKITAIPTKAQGKA
jgi:hypothetical protein